MRSLLSAYSVSIRPFPGGMCTEKKKKFPVISSRSVTAPTCGNNFHPCSATKATALRM